MINKIIYKLFIGDKLNKFLQKLFLEILSIILWFFISTCINIIIAKLSEKHQITTVSVNTSNIDNSRNDYHCTPLDSINRISIIDSVDINIRNIAYPVIISRPDSLTAFNFGIKNILKAIPIPKNEEYIFTFDADNYTVSDIQIWSADDIYFDLTGEGYTLLENCTDFNVSNSNSENIKQIKFKSRHTDISIIIILSYKLQHKGN